MSTYLVIFGAAVRADGRPSGSLLRRVQSAIVVAKDVDKAYFIPTGGKGATGFVEADVMGRLLIEAGVPGDAILFEREARDTLESVRKCDAILRSRDDVDRVIPCSSPYHLARCALLMRLLGWRVRMAPMMADRGHLPAAKLIRYYLKECLALPYDALLLMLSPRPRSVGVV